MKTKEGLYSFTLSLISALDGGGGCSQRHAPAALSLVETRYPLYRRLDGPQVRPGAENLDTTGIRSPDIPARRKDYAVLLLLFTVIIITMFAAILTF